MPQSRFVVFGMAAAPAGAGTRVGYLIGLRLPGIHLVGRSPSRCAGPLGRLLLRRVAVRFAQR